MNTYVESFTECTTVTQCLDTREALLNTGRIIEIKSIIPTASREEKPALGKELSELRNAITSASDQRIQEIQTELEKDVFSDFDPTFYSARQKSDHGNLHPIHTAMKDMLEIFKRMGFTMTEGTFVDTQWYNFDSLNMFEYHPARGMQDTFYLEDTDEQNRHMVLRTQTSNLEVRFGEQHQPPFRMIAPGLVFRNEKMDATHDVMFHQIEGLIIDKRVSLSHLAAILENAFKEYFQDDELIVRLRPSYFPFTNPSVEVDASCIFCKQEGCRICKQTGWVEICGAGLSHPKVIENMGIDSEEWQGLAFGMGFTRIAMLKYGIESLTSFYNGDIDLISQ